MNIKRHFLFSFLLLLISSQLWASPCCGPINKKAQSLEKVFDQMNVEKLWLQGSHVDWETGLSDKPNGYRGADTHSHCSAFAAALTKKLGAHLLTPIEHPGVFLASAQTKWLLSDEGIKNGWKRILEMQEAQKLANDGELVIAAFLSEKENKSGHIAIIRPSLKSIAELESDGPQIIQAGKKNYSSTSVRIGFINHKNAFPSKIFYFHHMTL